MPRNRYKRTYYVDQFGRLVAKGGNTGGRLRRVKKALDIMPNPYTPLGGQIPPGIPLGASREVELQEIERFARDCGINQLPSGTPRGIYTDDRPLEKVREDLYLGYRVKPDRKGGRRIMASDGWLCPVCGAYWNPDIKVCGLCKHKKGHKIRVKELRDWSDVMGHACERCGFHNLKPYGTDANGRPVCNKRDCYHILGTPFDKAKEPSATETKTGTTNTFASSGGYKTNKEDTEMAKKKASGKSKGEFLSKPLEWWESKAMRYGVYLVLANGKAMLTDEEMFGMVQDRFPDNGSIQVPSHIGWARGMLNGAYESTPCPKYAEGATVPPRYYLTDKGKRTTVRPVKGTEAAKASGPDERPKGRGKTQKAATKKKPAAKRKS